MRLPDLKFDLFSRDRKGADKGDGKGVQAPKLLRDLYADLRDRRLIPLVILLLVAIAAVPFLLGNKGDEEEPAVVPSVPAVATGSSAASEIAVVPAARRLRAYGDRLGYRKARNPFGSGEGGSGGEEPTSSSSPSGGGTTNGSTSSGAGSSEGTRIVTRTITKTKTKTKLVKATIKAQVGYAAVLKAGFAGSTPTSIEVEDQTKLPAKNPVIVYTGHSKSGGALFLMTSQVSEFTGDGKCVVGGSLCQVVELKLKQSETFRIGYGETRYKVQLMGFEPIVEEEIIEANGKRIRVPNKKRRNSNAKSQESGGGEGEGQVGTQPSPRALPEELLPPQWREPRRPASAQRFSK